MRKTLLSRHPGYDAIESLVSVPAVWYNVPNTPTLYSTSGVITMKVSNKKLWVLCAEPEISQALWELDAKEAG